MTINLPALSRNYSGNDKFSLDTPELLLSGGGYTCVIGLNGSGKSSFGEALAAGSTSLKWNYLPQYLERFLFAEHVLDQLEELLGRSVDKSDLAEELKEMGFTKPEEVFSFPFMLMSGGERRRIALATVFYLKPAFLILDEPEIGITAKENMVLLTKLNNLHAAGTQVIIISHNAEFVREASDLICMKEGRVDKSGTTKELLEDSDFKLEAYGVRFE